eukprot:1404968-Pyramimonas_sp.AAC.1
MRAATGPRGSARGPRRASAGPRTACIWRHDGRERAGATKGIHNRKKQLRNPPALSLAPRRN